MKYVFALVLSLVSCLSTACIVGPKEIAANTDLGFKFEIESSPWCNECNQIYIEAPEEYESAPFSHGLFTVSHQGKVVSRSIHSSVTSEGVPEFVGVVSNQSGFSYEITFEYGEGRCMSYQFSYAGEVSGS